MKLAENMRFSHVLIVILEFCLVACCFGRSIPHTAQLKTVLASRVKESVEVSLVSQDSTASTELTLAESKRNDWPSFDVILRVQKELRALGFLNDRSSYSENHLDELYQRQESIQLEFALRRFQLENDLPVTGIPDRRTIEQILNTHGMSKNREDMLEFGDLQIEKSDGHYHCRINNRFEFVRPFNDFTRQNISIFSVDLDQRLLLVNKGTKKGQQSFWVSENDDCPVAIDLIEIRSLVFDALNSWQNISKKVQFQIASRKTPSLRKNKTKAVPHEIIKFQLSQHDDKANNELVRFNVWSQEIEIFGVFAEKNKSNVNKSRCLSNQNAMRIAKAKTVLHALLTHHVGHAIGMRHHLHDASSNEEDDDDEQRIKLEKSFLNSHVAPIMNEMIVTGRSSLTSQDVRQFQNVFAIQSAEVPNQNEDSANKKQNGNNQISSNVRTNPENNQRNLRFEQTRRAVCENRLKLSHAMMGLDGNLYLFVQLANTSSPDPNQFVDWIFKYSLHESRLIDNWLHPVHRVFLGFEGKLQAAFAHSETSSVFLFSDTRGFRFNQEAKLQQTFLLPRRVQQDRLKDALQIMSLSHRKSGGSSGGGSAGSYKSVVHLITTRGRAFHFNPYTFFVSVKSFPLRRKFPEVPREITAAAVDHPDSSFVDHIFFFCYNRYYLFNVRTWKLNPSFGQIGQRFFQCNSITTPAGTTSTSTSTRGDAGAVN